MNGPLQEGDPERKLGRTVRDCAGFSARCRGHADCRLASMGLPHRGRGQNGCPVTGTVAESSVHAEVNIFGAEEVRGNTKSTVEIGEEQ